MTKRNELSAVAGAIDWDDIDPGIVEVVRLLRSQGFPTHFSCQGGVGHPRPLPMIVFGARRGETPERTRDEAATALLAAGYRDFTTEICRYHGDTGRSVLTHFEGRKRGVRVYPAIEVGPPSITIEFHLSGPSVVPHARKRKASKPEAEPYVSDWERRAADSRDRMRSLDGVMAASALRKAEREAALLEASPPRPRLPGYNKPEPENG